MSSINPPGTDPNEVNVSRFHELPTEIQVKIFDYLDLPSVCWFYVAYAPYPAYNVTRENAAGYLTGKKIPVTSEVVVEGNHRQIDFYTYGELPLCDIDVTTTVGLLALTKRHLTQMQTELVSVTIENNFALPVPCDLTGFGGSVTALTIDGAIRIDPKQIPLSVVSLTFVNHDVFEDTLDIRHLTNLRHFTCEYFRRLQLPQLLNSLTYGPRRLLNLRGMELPNLKHVCGEYFQFEHWGQIETAEVGRFPTTRRFDELHEVKICDVFNGIYPIFKELHCPKLEKVEFCHDVNVHRDVTEVFSDAQLDQLTVLKGPGLIVSNMELLANMKVLHFRVAETLTEAFFLPPSVTELRVWLTCGVDGIPPQLKVFEYQGVVTAHGAPSVVVVVSQSLERMVVNHAKGVTIECPHLTSLSVNWVEEPGDLVAPKLEKLEAIETLVAMEGLPRLKHVVLKGKEPEFTGDGGSHEQRVVVNHRLKSVAIEHMVLLEVSLVADEVSLKHCKSRRPPLIKAETLTLYFLVFHANEVECRELRCSDLDVLLWRVPRMVEKLVLGSWCEYWNWGLFIPPVPFAHCDRLRAVTIKRVNLKGMPMSAIPLPATVKHVSINVENWDISKFQFAEDTELEHLECWSKATLDQLGIYEYPPSYFFPQSVEFIRSLPDGLLNQR